MKIPIFPNSSYLISVGYRTKFDIQIKKHAAFHGCRTFSCEDLASFKRMAPSIKHVIGVIIYVDKMSPPEILSAVKIAATRRTPIRIVGSQSTPSEDWGVPYVHCPLDGSEEILAEVVSQITQARLPKGLENTMVTAANLIFPNFFSGLSGFQASAGENLKQQPDRQINFSVVAGDVVGYCATKFNLNSLTPLIPVENNSRKPPVAQEAVNQFLGLILQKMVKVGVDAKVGLPTLFDLTRIPEIRTLAFFPSVHISDSQGQVGISLGFIDLEANPLFDLSSLDSGSDSNDVEFL